MGSHTELQTKIAGVLGGIGLLAMVGYGDYITGYEITFFLFYLLPILYVRRYVGIGFAFVMALISAVVWLFVNIAAGEHYSDLLTPIWNTSIRLRAYSTGKRAKCLALFTTLAFLQWTRDGSEYVVGKVRGVFLFATELRRN